MVPLVINTQITIEMYPGAENLSYFVQQLLESLFR